MDNRKIGLFISELRKEKGLKQSELAELLSVSDKTISKWETGRGVPDISIIQSLASTFNISVEELLNGEKSAEPTQNNDEVIIKKFKTKKYLRLLAEVVITCIFGYVIYMFVGTFSDFSNVLDIYLHKAEIQFTALCMTVMIIFFVLWCAVAIITALLKRKASVIKTIIICLSLSFFVGVSVKMAEFDDSHTVAMYDEPTDIVQYVEYDSFFSGNYDTQINILDTNDIITEHYKVSLDSPDGEHFVYTSCVATNDSEITRKYFEEQKKVLTLNADYTELDEAFCKKLSIDYGYYIKALYFDESVKLCFVSGNKYYCVDISQSSVNNPTLLDEIARLVKDKNHNHQLNWWFAKTLKASLLALPLEVAQKYDIALQFQAAAHVRLFIFAYLFLAPVNGSMYSLSVIWSFA